MYFYWKICYLGHFLYTAPGQPGGPRLYQGGPGPLAPRWLRPCVHEYQSQLHGSTRCSRSGASRTCPLTRRSCPQAATCGRSDAEELPASLEDPGFGYVRYTLRAYVEVSGVFTNNIECKRMLHVAPQVALDKRRHLFTPMEFNEPRQVSNWYCGANGTIDVVVTCSTRGFVPGDTLPIDVLLVNNSGADVDRVCAKLKVVVDLDAYNHRVHHKQHKNRVAFTEVKPHIRAHSGRHSVQL